MPPKPPLKKPVQNHSGKPAFELRNLSSEGLKLRPVLPRDGISVPSGVKVFEIENASFPYKFRIEFWNGSEFKGSRMVYRKEQVRKILSGEMK